MSMTSQNHSGLLTEFRSLFSCLPRPVSSSQFCRIESAHANLQPTTFNLFSNMSNITYKSISLVFDSWELARQRFPCEGARILLDLFKAEPATKIVFGFQEDQDLGSIDKRQ